MAVEEVVTDLGADEKVLDAAIAMGALYGLDISYPCSAVAVAPEEGIFTPLPLP